MPTLKKTDYEKWTAQAANGFKFDSYNYILWGEKELIRYIDNGDGTKTRYRLQYAHEYETITNNYGCRYNRETGRYIPELTISKMTPTTTEGCWNIGQPARYTIGEPQTKRNYNTLCKLSATINIDDYSKPTATGAYALI